MTPDLGAPIPTVRESYIVGLREFHAEERNTHLDADALSDATRFDAFVEQLAAEALAETPRPNGWVPGTTLWYLDGTDFIGTLQIRHWLTDELRRVGGHIGYEVRPSRRREGHATRMLALALPVARSLGITDALLTCDATNEASRKVIETNGGRADTPAGPKLRYWIATA